MSAMLIYLNEQKKLSSFHKWIHLVTVLRHRGIPGKCLAFEESSSAYGNPRLRESDVYWSAWRMKKPTSHGAWSGLLAKRWKPVLWKHLNWMKGILMSVDSTGLVAWLISLSNRHAWFLMKLGDAFTTKRTFNCSLIWLAGGTAGRTRIAWSYQQHAAWYPVGFHYRRQIAALCAGSHLWRCVCIHYSRGQLPW